MIEIKTKIHDKFSVEFKESFVVRQDVKDNNFAINTWIFVPNSLDINALTYGKEQFYRDVKSNVRLITPVYLLRDIAEETAAPRRYLIEAMEKAAREPSRENLSEYEYQIKMFCAISKSSVRDESLHICTCRTSDDILFLSGNYLRNIESLLNAYRSLHRIINVPTLNRKQREFFSFGDEYLGHIASLYSFRVLKKLDGCAPQSPEREALAAFIVKNEAYKKNMGYPIVQAGDKASNRDLVFRHGLLKKYMESDLYIRLKKKKDGVAVKQLLYSIAAGLAMVFATIISFAFQRSFGSLSIPLFFALIISYMLKDRIKELMRYFFAHRLGKKYFDNKAIIHIKDAPIGWIKEGVDFITDKKTPQEVLNIRNRSTLMQAENHIFDEKIILYRKIVYIDSLKLARNNIYPVQGINDILRLHVNRFTQKMDNPKQMLDFIAQDNKILEILSHKIYYLNVIVQVRYDQQTEYRRFSIVLTRDGIESVEETALNKPPTTI